QLTGDGVRLLPIRLRYAWPSELGLMAQLAGLVLRERYEDFERRPVNAASTSHVSIYVRAGGRPRSSSVRACSAPPPRASSNAAASMSRSSSSTRRETCAPAPAATPVSSVLRMA